MEPLILILAAGYGERLYLSNEITSGRVVIGDDQFPKGRLKIGGKRLIDFKVESLPPGIRRAILLRDPRVEEKFLPLEERLRDVHGFGDNSIIYQDQLISLGYMPKSFTFSTEELAYYLSIFFRSSEYQGKFDPIIFVPADTIVEGMDYLELLAQHRKENADVIMVMKEGFNRGSNTRVYTVENGRFVAAGPYLHKEWEARGCPEDMGIRLEQGQKILTHEGTYVVGGRFSEIPLGFFRKSYLESDFTELFRTLKVVPYVNIVNWIDVRDVQNLELAKSKFGKLT